MCPEPPRFSRPVRAGKGLISRLIERRFGGYRQLLAPVDERLPVALQAPRRVAVIGAGLAGMGAATKLAERGFTVTLLERNEYLGGKVGAWKTTMPDGREIGMSHGFHAFFHHYYNLNEFFSQLGIDRHYRNIGDYLILTADGRSYSFKDVATAPILNLISLARHGVYDFWEVARTQTGPKMEALLRYDPDTTFAKWDHVSYAEFAEDAQLPDSLALVFNSFSRAFFSDADKMSMAELIKSFHFYYLSNDGGLIYEYLDDDYDKSLLAPLRAYMERHGVEIRTGCEIVELSRAADGEGFEVDGEEYDYVVVASDVVGTRALFEASPALAEAAPETAAKVATLTPGQRYSVLRLWLDRGIARELPGFVITDRQRMLDAVTFVHQVERESSAWVAERKADGLDASVVELHCYAVPEQLPEDQAELRALFLAELHEFFPELADAQIIHEHMYVRRDFPGFHVGKHATRPSVATDCPRVFLAGDWVVLPFPAMLMEAAYSAGLLAANGICRAESLREEPVFTVPPRGFLAGLPERPV
jgi:carotenoid phi-ring synthase / carotenoid chi-ring synthase